jgi:hypothetical protein
MSIDKNSNRIPEICSLNYVRIDEIDSILQGTDQYHQVITLKNGSSWKKIYFTPGSGEFTEVEKTDDSGNYFEISLKADFPGEDEDNLSYFNDIIERPLVILVRFSFNKSKIIGSLENPAKAVTSKQITQKAKGSNLQFLCKSSGKSLWFAPGGNPLPG